MSPLAAVPVVVWALADSTGGFTASGDSGQWEWGAPTSGPGGVTSVWGTRLAGDYFNDATDHLEVPVPDLSGVAYPVLSFTHWYVIQPGDLGVIEVNDGSGWVAAEPIFGYPMSAGGFVGASFGWVESSVDLSGLGAAPRVRFSFRSNPTVSAAGWYLSEVALFDGDVTAPRIVPRVIPGDTEVVEAGYPVELEVTDDTAIASVVVRASVNGAPAVASALVDRGGGLYAGEIPAAPPGSVVTWHAEADDGEQLGRYPAAGSESFRVTLPAPTDLHAVVAGRVVADAIDLAWAAPVSQHAVLSYRVEPVDLAGEGPWVVFDTEATVPLAVDGARTFQVRAVYDVGVGEASAPWTVAADVPELGSLAPAVAWPGDTVRVRVRGRNLYLAQEAVALDLGAGVTVDAVEVVDVDEAVALVSVAADAEPGPRDVVIGSSWGSFATPAAFEVLDGAMAPRIVSVEPGSLEQGRSALVTLVASQVFAGEVVADVGPGLLLLADPVVDGDRVSLELVVAQDATPGPHTLVLDDGARLWTADLEVEERVFTAETSCGGCNQAPDRTGFAAWLILLALRRRRP